MKLDGLCDKTLQNGNNDDGCKLHFYGVQTNIST